VGYFLAALASFAVKVSNRKGCKENQRLRKRQSAARRIRRKLGMTLFI
jgi:hypothetical protein